MKKQIHQVLKIVKEIQKIKSPGDLVALADQDDIWLPHKLLLLSQKIENNDLIYHVIIIKKGEYSYILL